MNIPFALPDIGEEEINEVVASMRSGWITTGPKVKQFEEDFQNFIGVKHALAVNSATSGLHLAMEALGVKAGDKVIVPTYTFTSTAEVVRYLGADPIFCDIDPVSYCIDTNKLEELIKIHHPKVVAPVHYAGQAAEMDKILALKDKYGFKICEDAAHALPTKFNNQLIGTFGDITVFSFYVTKTLCTGEGGMIVTNNDDYAKRMKVMRLHGFSRDAWDRYTSNKASWAYEIIAPGYKYNMMDISAAMGIHQLKKAYKFFDRRNEIARRYTEAFSKIEGLETPHIKRENCTHAYHLYRLGVPASIRDEFIVKMKEAGVGCSVHFIPLHTQPYWRDKYNLKEQDFPVAMKVFKGSVSLPIYTKMTDEEVKFVIDTVIRIYNETTV